MIVNMNATQPREWSAIASHARARDAEVRTLADHQMALLKWEARMWRSAARRWMAFSTLTVVAWIVCEIVRVLD